MEILNNSLAMSVIKRWDSFLNERRKRKLLAEKKRRSCYLCGVEDDALKLCYIWYHGNYGDYKHYYKFHTDCLQETLECPEVCGNEKVDTALKIIEMMDYWNNRKAEAKEKLERGY